MGIKFTDTEGSAKTKLEYFKFIDGINKFRMVGDVLPRYVYWAKSYDGQANLPIECLSFDRKVEKFTNMEKDWFSHYFPDKKCTWAYVIQCFDYSESETEPKLKVVALKKKLFQQIVETAKKEKFGDPTDLESGWTCVVNRNKTGSLNYNVEYNLDQFECLDTKRPLNDHEKSLIEDLKSIDELMPRQTPDEQKAFIERAIIAPVDSNTDEEAAKEAEAETGAETGTKDDDDIPF